MTKGIKARAEARILKHSVSEEDGCWFWTGFKTHQGYGKCQVPEWGEQLAHRVSYIVFRGSIPEGLTLDHLCRNRSCVNPWHLEPVDARTNTLRGEGMAAKRSRQTHCKRGHEFTPENTYLFPDGRRQCKTCRLDYQRAWHKKRREGES